jgi:cysteine desulfurase
MSEWIYADHAATTRVSDRALEAMMPFLREEYANPSAVYAPGRRVRRALDRARETVAAAFGAQPGEIYFTGGGTESDNWVIRAAAELQGGEKKRLITSAVEHHAILRTFETMRRRGYEAKVLGVDRNGRISLEALRAAAGKDAALVSVMTANNEVGTVMPVAEIGAAAHDSGAVFHTDAVQAAGHIPIDVDRMGIDMMSFSGHKFGGPKGVGGLFVRKGLPIPPGLFGGGQERGLRSGTENVAGIVGMAAALEESCRNMRKNAEKASRLRDRLIRGVLRIPGTRLTGDPENRLPGHASFLFDGVEGEALVLLLDQNGICASSGSACSAGALEPSHVLLAMGFSAEEARGSLRLTLGPDNTDAEIDALLEKLPNIIVRLRSGA